MRDINLETLAAKTTEKTGFYWRQMSGILAAQLVKGHLGQAVVNSIWPDSIIIY